MKKVYIFFGEMGCGKSYLGQKFSKNNECDFFEGDSVVTPAMAEKVAKFKPIPMELLDEYMDVLFDKIADKMLTTDTLVVSQALYLDSYRTELKLYLESFGYEVDMCLVKVPFLRNIRQLLTRPQGWKWVLYWAINKPFFQTPTHPYRVIENKF